MMDEWDGNPKRRTTDSGYPWWLNAIYKVGVPSAIAIFLVWFMTTQVRDNLNSIKENLMLHSEVNIKSLQANEFHNDKLFKLLQRICANSAKTNTERVECFR